MKATGIVRRIDELGRVVIPKEIRRTLRIKVGDPLEIYTDRDGQIIFKKYSPIAEISSIARIYADVMGETLDCSTFICDKDNVLACYGAKRKEYENAPLGKNVLQLLGDKKTMKLNKDNIVEIIDREDTSDVVSQIITPVLIDNEPIGCVILVSKDKEFDDNAVYTSKTCAILIEKQIDY